MRGYSFSFPSPAALPACSCLASLPVSFFPFLVQKEQRQSLEASNLDHLSSLANQAWQLSQPSPSEALMISAGHVSTAGKSQGGSVTGWSTSASRPQEYHPRFGAQDSVLRCAANAITSTMPAISAEISHLAHLLRRERPRRQNLMNQSQKQKIRASTKTKNEE